MELREITRKESPGVTVLAVVTQPARHPGWLAGWVSARVTQLNQQTDWTAGRETEGELNCHLATQQI